MEKKRPKTETVIIGVLHTLVTIAAVVTIVRACITVNAEENTKRYSYYAYQEHVMYNVFWAEAIIENSFYAETNYPIAAYSELIYTDATYGDCYSYVLCKLSSTGILEAYTLPVVESVLIKNDGVTNASNYIVENGLSTLCSGNDTAYHRYRTSTNIPIFNTRDEVLNYLQTGDKTGQLNTFEQDDTLALAGFDCDNTVKATWTDYVCNREINPDHLTIGVSAVYTDGKNSSQVAQNVVRYSAMSFEKAYADYAALNPYGEAAELVLKFLPMYMDTESGTTYEGRAISVYFNADGSVREISESGFNNNSGGNYDDKHNFSNDVIDTSIPLPVLSRVSHEGFTIDNVGDYYVDVIVENCLYGVGFPRVDMSDSGDEWYDKVLDFITTRDDKPEISVLMPDTSWIYKQKHFNIADHTDFALNQSTINLLNDYGIDNLGSLTAAFMEWSVEYPDARSLPSWNWAIGNLYDDIYSMGHVYNPDSDKTLEAQLIDTGRAQTTYYVRFYTAENRTGQWMSYKFRDGYLPDVDKVGTANSIVSGSIDVDSEGNVHIKNPITGNVTDDGYINYIDTSTNVALNGESFYKSLARFSGTLDEVGNTVSSVPDYVNRIFGFLPWWCNALIGLGVAAVVILRFLGR